MALIEFNAEFIERLAVGLDARTAYVTREFVRVLHDKVIELTPRVSGKAANNWNIGIGEPNIEVRPASGGVADNSAAIDRIDGRVPVFITNKVPYIRKLENGSSKMAPAGMVRAAELQAYDALDEILDKAENAVPLT